MFWEIAGLRGRGFWVSRVLNCCMYLRLSNRDLLTGFIVTLLQKVIIFIYKNLQNFHPKNQQTALLLLLNRRKIVL